EQVLAERRRHRRAPDARTGRGALADPGHGNRNSQGESAPPVREVLPGRQLGRARDRWDRPRSLSGSADRRADRRSRRVRLGRRVRRDLLLHGARRPVDAQVPVARRRSLPPTRRRPVAIRSAGVDGLALKLVLTPTLIGAVSMAGRRWGPGVSDWLVGFPLTSGPIAFFLALDYGLSFAAGAAVGSMTGAAAQAAFCVLYGRLARRHWTMALLAGSLAFAAATVLLQLSTLTLVPLLGLVVGTLVVALIFMPRDSGVARPAAPPPWDIPARLVVTTAIVLLLTGLATAL